MKHRLALFATVAVLLALLPAAAHAACSLSSVAGSYGYAFSGFVSPAAGSFFPAAASGRITFNADGTVRGSQTRVVAGSALEETYSGTYTVHANCRGSFTVVVQPDTRTSTVSVVWVDNTKGVKVVFTTPGFTLTGDAERITPID